MVPATPSQRIRVEIDRVRAARDPGQVRTGPSLVERQRDQPQLGGDADDLLVDRCSLLVERTVHRVDDGDGHGARECGRDQSRVVADDVELVRAGQAREGMVELGRRLTDACRRSPLVDRSEPCACPRVARCKQRYVVACRDQSVGENPRPRRCESPPGARAPRRDSRLAGSGPTPCRPRRGSRQPGSRSDRR